MNRLADGRVAAWTGLPGAWRVEGDTIVGKLPAGRNNSTFLCSEKTYKDFELRFSVCLKNGVGNSGLQVRSTIVQPAEAIDAGPHRN